MRVLLTGGAGFIGSHLLTALLERRDEVVCLDNFDPFYARADKERNLAEVGKSPRLRVVEGDVCDVEGLEALFAEQRPQVVLHLAAKAGVRPSLADPAGYLSVNACGTLNILQMAAKYQVSRLVFTSSSSVYGGLTRLPFTEDQNTLHPLSPYAASKLAAEVFCHAFRHLHRLRIVILRLFTVYGPRQRPDLAISKFARLIDQGDPLPLFGDGRSSRDYTHVDDIVRGILAAADSDLEYATVNLGRSHPVTLLELVEALGHAIGKRPRIEFQPAQQGDMPHTYADIALAHQLLGWEPHIELAEGLRGFVEWQWRHEKGAG